MVAPQAGENPASQHTREELTALIEGRLSTASAKDELVKLATGLIVEEALEGEAGDALGREYYEHGSQPGQGYRNGYRPGRLKTAEGRMEYSAPQIAGRDEPFRSAIREHLGPALNWTVRDLAKAIRTAPEYDYEH